MLVINLGALHNSSFNSHPIPEMDILYLFWDYGKDVNTCIMAKAKSKIWTLVILDLFPAPCYIDCTMLISLVLGLRCVFFKQTLAIRVWPQILLDSVGGWHTEKHVSGRLVWAKRGCILRWCSWIIFVFLIISPGFGFGISPCIFLWINQDKTQELIETLLYLPFLKIVQLEVVRKNYWERGPGDEGQLILLNLMVGISHCLTLVSS